MSNQQCNLVTSYPTRYAQVQDSHAWSRSMQDKLGMIQNNGTQQLVDKPINHKVIGVKWILMTKINHYGTICKHKASLVVQ